jgi:hypothetical protein
LILPGIAVLGGVFCAGAAAVYLVISRGFVRLKRESYIRQYVFPASILRSVTRTYPELKEKDLFLIARALRSYFLAHLKSRSATVGMPSRAADALWHDFILDTRAYHTFCDKAFGSYFHHIPAGKSSSAKTGNEALRRTWRLTCLEENIDPRNATRLPLLFALDAKLQIPDGFIYDLDAVKQAPRADSSSAGCSGGFACSGGDCDSGGCSGGCGGGCGGD